LVREYEYAKVGMSLLDRFDRGSVERPREVDAGQLSSQKRPQLSNCNRRHGVS
jgi:hypothetical protein